MSYQHKELANGKWFKLSFPAQMANIGSEVIRAISWKNKKRLRELTRLNEVLADYFAFNNEYKSSDRSWQNYFFAFNYMARLGH